MKFREILKTFTGEDFYSVLSELLILKFETGKRFDLIIKEHKDKRSKEANAYCWVLLNKLSNVLKIPSIELYRTFIYNIGAYEVVALKADRAKPYIRTWQAKGLGWIAEIISEDKSINRADLRVFHGSSVYTKAEMAKFIDEIVFECQEQGIETKTPDEIEKMKSLWKEEK